MAVYRKIETSFWQDPFILELDPEEKYFYLYLMTNTKTSQCGIYEISKAVMQMELGLDRKRVDELLQIFVDYGKIIYSESTHEIMIINWIKYNGSTSPTVLKRVDVELREVKNPSLVIEYLKRARNENIPIDTLYIPYGYCIDTLEIKKDAKTEGMAINTQSETISIPYPYSIDTKTQKEEEEEKEEEKEETKTKEEEEGSSRQDKISQVALAFENNGFGTINQTIKEDLVYLIEEYSVEWIIEAFKVSVRANKRSLNYVKGILQNWKTEGGMKLGGGGSGSKPTRDNKENISDEPDAAERAGVISL